ncbi:transcriptional regulator, LysR family protein [Roseobacter sp. SK209-2-6]|uniref:LysR family transcriptional regulator n=1 Tax=Roseobacter sp. SK209-2-6 TaxID=388739 RepID=UPI0000F3C1CF|nr:LysR family transcriptional regulator [Roseobacter sp. SK209-2-6]EBA15339.1 transcriptional regulator, LysR family protein [Roseobacter sp. SK209-2-6]
MQRTDLSLKWLEVFQLAASLGSAQAVARETGLSISTVSHHLHRLEDQLGVSLLDHKKRPMVLTPAGSIFLKYIEEALGLIRKAQAEASSGNLHEARQLRLGLIEDFDSEIGPELAVYLASHMPKCSFTHHTRASHDILELLRKRRIDIGLANRPGETVHDLQETPFLRDPFVLALPVNTPFEPEDFLAGQTNLPFLRYSTAEIISGQIETQLRRLKIALPQRFEIESNQTLMAMVASGNGWAVTTPLCYMRAKRFHRQVKLHPFPEKSFARHLSMFATPECAKTSQQIVHKTLQNLVLKRALKPALEMMPWLHGMFELDPCD